MTYIQTFTRMLKFEQIAHGHHHSHEQLNPILTQLVGFNIQYLQAHQILPLKRIIYLDLNKFEHLEL